MEKKDNLNTDNPDNQKYTDESGENNNIDSKLSTKDKEIKKEKTDSDKLTNKEKRAQKAALKKEKKTQKINKRQAKNSRWFWFFIILLLAIIVLFMWDNHKKTNFIKEKIKTADSLKYSEHFFKTKFQEKDSSLNKLLANYNKLLENNIENSDELLSNKKELLKLQKTIYLQDSILRQVKESFDVALGSYSKNQVAVQMKEGKLYITMRSKLLFPSGSANVQSSGMTALRILSRILKKNPNINVVIEGHTDNVPISPKNKKFKDNWDLSTARAVNVTRILTKRYNIRPERLTAAGRSMFFPVAPNTTAAGRAKNRRIEFILTPNLEELYKLSDIKMTSK